MNIVYIDSGQRGAVLIVGLIFLVVMSIMGLTAMQNVTLQERLTGNTLDRFRAAQEAEISLLIAEKTVEDTTFSSDSDYFNDSLDAINYADPQFWATCNDISIDKESRCESLGGGNAVAKYQDTSEVGTYLITVRGQGIGRGQVMLQSRYQGRLKEQD